jgi:hypothetical protein
MFSTRRASLTAGLMVVGLFFALAGVSARQDQGSAVTLAYQFPEGKTLSYRTVSSEKQYMQVSGQDITTSTESSLEFTAKPRSSKDGVHGIAVTIDAMKIRTLGPQGDLSPVLDHIPGKSFDMSLTRQGKETDTAGAAAITYVLGTSSRDLSSGFQAFFPDLPDRAVKQGFLVKSDSKAGFSGSVTVAQANMTIPVTGESTEEVRLVRK